MAPATDPPLVIVGTGRSGSGYISAVLRAAGMSCGHEEWWNPLGEQHHGLWADSSWCAVGNLDGYEGYIGHQVRHPLKVVASLITAPDHGPYIACREAVMGPLPEDPLERAVATYVRWNEACEKLTEDRWRVEDVDSHLLVELAARSGWEMSTEAAKGALAEVAGNFNDHGPHEELHWGDLRYTEHSVRLHDLAERYGYA